jgi:hypothetical protein
MTRSLFKSRFALIVVTRRFFRTFSELTAFPELVRHANPPETLVLKEVIEKGVCVKMLH